jgi:hypothetical protein
MPEDRSSNGTFVATSDLEAGEALRLGELRSSRVYVVGVNRLSCYCSQTEVLACDTGSDLPAFLGLLKLPDHQSSAAVRAKHQLNKMSGTNANGGVDSARSELML